MLFKIGLVYRYEKANKPLRYGRPLPVGRC
jgi:hypothetical protein